MKQFTLLLLIVIASLNTNAQKIPDKQGASIRVPADMKVDGKATEWGDGFRAYNSATEVYYTIANDDKNLYLAIRATDAVVIRKIIAGSITFSVSVGGNKEPVSVTYPLFDRKATPKINLRNKAAIIANAVTVDSFMMAANKELISNAKKIKLSGVKGKNDTLSIYNEEGITVAGLFNNHADYTYELTLPLKYLSAIAAEVKVLNYNIKLNGSAYIEGVFFERIEGGMRRTSDVKNSPEKPWPAMKDMEIMAAQTDMSGTYTLAQ